MSLEAFRRIQIGVESVRGSAVAATKKLIGTLTMTPEAIFHRPVDERNSLAEFFREIEVARRSSLRFEGDATYEQLIDFLSMSMKGSITPTTPGGGTDSRDWTFTPNLTTKNVQDSYTIEYGDDTQEFETKFSLVENLELAIAMNEAVVLRADMFAHQATKSTFTGALNDIAVNEIIAGNLKIYIDGVWGNAGTTQKASLLAGGIVRLPTGLVPVKYADGSLDFSAISEQRRHMEMELDLIMGADAITEYDAYLAGTTRVIRLEFTGPIIESAIPYKLIIDLTGKYTSPPEIFGERDGEDLIRLSISSFEDSNGNEMEIVVTNKETAL